MATITVDQQKLVLNAFAARFQNNLLAKDLVTWKKYDNEMDDKNGFKVSEQIGQQVRRAERGPNTRHPASLQVLQPIDKSFAIEKLCV